MNKSARMTRRRNCRLGVPGRLRRRVAKLLSEHFGEYIDPTYVRPAKGYYRTSRYADCYRWELSDGVRWLGCWMTMTDFVRDVRKYGGIIIKGDVISPKHPERNHE